MNNENKFCYKYPRPAYTVDAAIIYNSKILLIERGKYPYIGKWALPGGFMDMGETPEQAAIRELKEETGIIIKSIQQFKTYGTIDRDPRHRTISTVFYHILEDEIQGVEAGDDASDAQWFLINNLPEMAFDHKLIIEELISKLKK